MGPKRRNRTASRTHEKIGITLPRRLAEAVRLEAKGQPGRSVSSFIADVLEEKLEHDRLQDVLDEIFAEQPMTDEERAWADRALGH